MLYSYNKSAMKHKGNTNEYKQQQDTEVMSAYRRIFGIYGGIVGVRRLYELVAFAPASRFFVSELQASRVIKRFARGDAVSNMRGGRLRMYSEIHSRVRELRSECPDMPVSRAVAKVVCQPAPEMYISPRQISAIIDKERKKCYEERRQRFFRSL